MKKLTWAKGIGADGRPIRNENQDPSEKGTKVCPAVLGATNWWSAAYDNSSGLFYLQTIESCGVYNKRTMTWEAGRGFMGGSSRNAPGEPTATDPASVGYLIREACMGIAADRVG